MTYLLPNSIDVDVLSPQVSGLVVEGGRHYSMRLSRRRFSREGKSNLMWLSFLMAFVKYHCCNYFALPFKQLLEKLHEKWNLVKKPYPAMYSSIFGGIITDPAMMVIPIDDHMVHRGHGVFDTAIILNGLVHGNISSNLFQFLKISQAAEMLLPYQPSLL